MRMGRSASIIDYDLAVVVGAGASVPLLPSQRSLIPDLWAQTTPPYPVDLPILRPARAYLARTFPGLPHGEVSFEDVVGPLEIAESEEYWFHFADRDSKGRCITNHDVLDAFDTWLTRAGRALAGAARWLIVGYSLPLADVWMLRLLAQSARSGGKLHRDIVVVDPNDSVLQRFRLLFPDARLGAHTFEEYLDRSKHLGWLA